jgi:hypothetical protein
MTVGKMWLVGKDCSGAKATIEDASTLLSYALSRQNCPAILDEQGDELLATVADIKANEPISQEQLDQLKRAMQDHTEFFETEFDGDLSYEVASVSHLLEQHTVPYMPGMKVASSIEELFSMIEEDEDDGPVSGLIIISGVTIGNSGFPFNFEPKEAVRIIS